MSPRPARSDVRAPDDSDVRLVARARAGDRDAFEQLVRGHADRLYGVVRRLGVPPMAAEEITQEAFLRAWRGLAEFRGDARFFTWLYRIAVNEAKRWLRRERVRVQTRPLEDDELADEQADPHGRTAETELRRALERAVRRLPLKYRAPLILRDIEGLSTAEAASILGIGEAAFKSRLHRARLAVRDEISDEL